MRKLLRRLRHFWRRRQMAEELAEEMEFHRALQQRELEESGLSRQEAASTPRGAPWATRPSREKPHAPSGWRLGCKASGRT